MVSGVEGPGVDAIYLSLWGTPFLEAWHRWRMPMAYRCCAEAVVSRAPPKKGGISSRAVGPFGRVASRGLGSSYVNVCCEGV